MCCCDRFVVRGAIGLVAPPSLRSFFVRDPFGGCLGQALRLWLLFVGLLVRHAPPQVPHLLFMPHASSHLPSVFSALFPSPHPPAVMARLGSARVRLTMAHCTASRQTGACPAGPVQAARPIPLQSQPPATSRTHAHTHTDTHTPQHHTHAHTHQQHQRTRVSVSSQHSHATITHRLTHSTARTMRR